jgi:iron complex outermembrane receptor protein
VVGWSEGLQSHLSIGKTLTRPDFAAMNPALSLIPPTVNAPGTGSAGNPYLKPTESINTDATLEYYFQKNGFAQIALFNRNIDGYLQSFEQAETINGQNYRINRPQNSGKGKLKGAEFGIQKFFDFLPGAWSEAELQPGAAVRGQRHYRPPRRDAPRCLRGADCRAALRPGSLGPGEYFRRL